MEHYINLPLSNEVYQYSYFINNKEIIEKNNITGEEIARFQSYDSFKSYYEHLNKRILLPDTINGLYSSKKFLLSRNYFEDKLRIIDINKNRDYYLQRINLNIDKNKLKNAIYIVELLDSLSEEISYQGADKFEIPIIILLGEYFRTSNINLKWVVKEDQNVLGEKFFYPEVSDNYEEYNLYNDVRKVLYNEKDDKIFNFRFLLLR
ncbi:hypothetical protein J2810_001230 [Chryseobacterium rhizosphaerae]|uniref:hypothetical protein n=1 Tax=Chryseobacterium rhizosphaerae TaxID=395937 RepID=UPI000646E2BA|nr:hypothetical protein [Chryseobacterium rhizosphaerae]MDR6545188.1 hypothetical protein [Chryseobacterium rhizosphaerae]